jgi:hypothetical protein
MDSVGMKGFSLQASRWIGRLYCSVLCPGFKA